ncbi:MAG: maleylpyruvate isomerase family mycothiol-dependent enzyme [Propioniciclava sp.]
MEHVLEYPHYGEALGNAASVIRSNAAAAGLAAPVPTCPGWSVTDLVSHVGCVYRWASASVRRVAAPAAEAALAEARGSVDLLDWFDDGLVDILNALGNAPADLDVPFLLGDAPAPRVAWARRQAHESTIHAVDAMAARLGRVPVASELWFSEELATDGLDELLTGWVPRVMATAEGSIGVVTDGGAAWVVGPEAGSVRRVLAAEGMAAATTFTGSATSLYIGLWNRGDEIAASARSTLEAWRQRVRV